MGLLCGASSPVGGDRFQPSASRDSWPRARADSPFSQANRGHLARWRCRLSAAVWIGVHAAEQLASQQMGEPAQLPN